MALQVSSLSAGNTGATGVDGSHKDSSANEAEFHSQLEASPGITITAVTPLHEPSSSIASGHLLHGTVITAVSPLHEPSGTAHASGGPSLAGITITAISPLHEPFAGESTSGNAASAPLSIIGQAHTSLITAVSPFHEPSSITGGHSDGTVI